MNFKMIAARFVIVNIILWALILTTVGIFALILYVASFNADLGVMLCLAIAMGAITLLYMAIHGGFSTFEAENPNGGPTIRPITNHKGKVIKYLVSWNTVLPPEKIAPLPEWAKKLPGEDK